MDALRCIYWMVVVPLAAAVFVLIVVPSIIIIAREAPHILLVMAALAVLAYLGVSAIKQAFRPRLLGGRCSPRERG